MARNRIGLTDLSPARSIEVGASIQARTRRDRPDLFRFNWSGNSLNLKLKSVRQDSTVYLIQDLNQDGLASANEVIKRRSAPPGRQRGLQFSNLTAGTYYIQVSPNGRASKYRLSLAVGSPPEAAQSLTPSSTNLSSILKDVVDRTNSFRQQQGLPPFTWNAKLANAAQAHTRSMALEDYVEHIGKDGSSVGDRLSAAGYDWSWAAENIAAGQETAAAVVQSWIDSPAHRANLLNPNLKEIGVGYYYLANDTGTTNYHSYWTQNFAAGR